MRQPADYHLTRYCDGVERLLQDLEPVRPHRLRRGTQVVTYLWTYRANLQSVRWKSGTLRFYIAQEAELITRAPWVECFPEALRILQGCL